MIPHESDRLPQHWYTTPKHGIYTSHQRIRDQTKGPGSRQDGPSPPGRTFVGVRTLSLPFRAGRAPLFVGLTKTSPPLPSPLLRLSSADRRTTFRPPRACFLLMTCRATEASKQWGSSAMLFKDDPSLSVPNYLLPSQVVGRYSIVKVKVMKLVNAHKKVENCCPPPSSEPRLAKRFTLHTPSSSGFCFFSPTEPLSSGSPPSIPTPLFVCHLSLIPLPFPSTY